MSESLKCATTTRSGSGGGGGTVNGGNKPSKPFCSLAYLAKSTVAINGGGNDIRIINGQSSNCQQTQPHLAATAKSAIKRNSPALPTEGAATPNGINHHHPHHQHHHHIHHHSSMNGVSNGLSNGDHIALIAEAKNELEALNSLDSDIFGEINEEQQALSCDEIDNCNGSDLRRPWELSTNSYVRRIPTALMTTPVTQNGLNGHGHGNSLSSLSSKLNSIDCWDYTIELECLKGPQDLQLAAELGKTLLERNKELETLLKEHKNTIEEQEQEIVYLKKHTTALREVNDSRLKVYEQLEVGIQDLERANHRLLVENSNDKKHIKTLTHNVETLEARCDELNKSLEETRQSLSMERRKNERLLQDRNSVSATDGAVRLKPTADSKSTADSSSAEGYEPNTTGPENCSFAFLTVDQAKNANSTGISGGGQSDKSLDLSIVGSGEDSEEIIKLVNDLETTKRALMAEQQRCTELEEQLGAIIQENQTLQSRIAQTSNNEEMKSMHDELSVLDEVRQGQMCNRCLRSVDDRATVNDEQSSIAPTEEEDDERSVLDDNASEISQTLGEMSGYRTSATIKISQRAPASLDLNCPASPNPYRDLVEKYEALLEVQRSSLARKCNSTSVVGGGGGVGGGGFGGNNNAGLSLAEELQTSGEFHQTQKLMIQAAAAVVAATASSTNGDECGSSCNGSAMNEPMSARENQNQQMAKNSRGRTPTEFSEAETSSSGYSGDDTSHKCTQTDDRPGYFLCSIGDGEDCKFSIYDDVSPIDSRFRNRPEYRELFKEIFAVLKKAAENKEEGDKLPLLDDTNNVNSAAVAKVPPVTPANEEPPTDFGDDAQSVISSAVSEQSFAMSECITKIERRTAKKHIIEKNQENKPPMSEVKGSIGGIAASATSSSQLMENGRVLTPLKREPLEYLTVGVGIKKKNRRKGRNFNNDRSESPVALPSPPRFFVNSGKKRRDARPMPITPESSSPYTGRGNAIPNRPKYEWNGNSMVIYNRSVNSPRGRGDLDLSLGGIEYRPSTVSQDLHKLKKLDLSYAEVLRRADACKHNHNQNQNSQQQLRRRHHNHHNHHHN